MEFTTLLNVHYPFTIQLLGEYVFEILETLNTHLNESNLDLYHKLIKENPRYWQITESRVGSYWNEHYRHKSRKFKKYLGYEMIQKILCSICSFFFSSTQIATLNRYFFLYYF